MNNTKLEWVAAMKCQHSSVIGVDSERMGDPATIYLNFILLFNIDVYKYIYNFMSHFMQYFL